MQVGELNLQLVGVGGEVDEAGGIDDVVNVDHGKVRVVDNLHARSGHQVDAVKRVQVGVFDADFVSLGDSLAKAKDTELGKSDQGDGPDLGESIHLERVQLHEALEVETLLDNLQLGCGDGVDLVGAFRDQAAGNALHVRKNKLARELVGNLDVTLDLGAGRQASGIALVLNGNIAATVGWIVALGQRMLVEDTIRSR